MGDVFVTGTAKGLVARLLSRAGINADGTSTAARQDTDGSQIVKIQTAKNLGLAEEGSLYIATTPTAGTGVKLCVDACTSITATAPSILLYNNDAVGGKSITLDSIRLVHTVAAVGNTTLNVACYLDSTTRYTSGGGAIVPANLNMTVPNTSIAKFYDASTAIVSPAATSGQRKVGRVYARTAIPVVGDQFLFDFGGNAGMSNGVTNGTAALNLTFPMNPVVIGPQQSFLVYLWAASMSTAPTFEYEVVWSER